MNDDFFDFLFEDSCVETDTASAVTLRPYQTEAIDGIFGALESNQSTLLVLPTGTGKTTVFCEAIRRSGKRALVLAHREELIFQAAKRLETFGIDAAIEMGDIHAREYLKPQAVVSTIQTQMSGKRMTTFDPFDFGFLVIDEVHHAVSRTYRKVIDYYRRNPELKILGVTATPDRKDEEALGQVLESVAFDYEILDAIHDGWLVPIEQQMVSVEDLDFSGIRTTAGDLNGADLASVMEAEKNLHGVASATLSLAEGKKTLIFTASVRQAEMLCEIFNRHNPGSTDWVCGAMKKDKRRLTLKRFSAGEFNILVNCAVLTEGYDEAGIEVVVQAKPTKSRCLYAQCIGRGTRPLPGLVDGLVTAQERRAAIASSSKPSILVIDFVGNAGRHKLVTTADVLGGKCSEEVIEEAKRRAAASGGKTRTDEELDAAAKEIEQRKLQEAAKKVSLIGIAKFKKEAISPFDVFHLQPAVARGWDRVKRMSEKQREVLTNNGIKTDNMTFTQASQLIGEIISRRKNGLCTAKQATLLTKHGYDASHMTMTEASECIDALAKNKWRRPD